MGETTERLALPLLQLGQAQKEMAHNAALAALDLIVAATVQAVGLETPPATPSPGQCWIIGQAPTGAWVGSAGALAGWTAGGWRFATPFEGLTVWSIADHCEARWSVGSWTVGVVDAGVLRIGGHQVVGAQRAAIADPIGGTVVDTEARATLAQILAALQNHGLVAA